ncbi:hypothetical protein IPJ72_01885 [Candidatus Peregrinibacteria bacterium]|nr:MAG: hypothetical protein IPJ72_01885 [Candidatus Peregrinibacteria bacterium]
MAKRSTPKKQQANSQSSRRYKAFQNKSRKKLMGMVEFMKRVVKNPRYQAIQEEKGKRGMDKITKIQA